MSRTVFSGVPVLITFLLIACGSGEERKDTKVHAGIPTYTFDDIRPMLERENDTLYVYNFWATWCVPCVKELPHFEKVNRDYADRKVKVVLISVDFEEDVESKLIPFIEERNIRSKVLNMDDPDVNRWIPLVDPSWEGAIPATLFRYGSKKKFMAHTFTHEELVNEIDKLLKQ